MRPSLEQYFMEIAKAAAARSTCRRRKVGCVLVNDRNHIISTGYNGSPRGALHCINTPCSGVAYASGRGLDECHSIHAEQNAIAHAESSEIALIVVTTSPCMSCMKLLLASSARRLLIGEVYDEMALTFWKNNGGTWKLIK